MSEQVHTLTPGGSPLATSLGFGARSVVVDNYTSSYVSLPDVGKTIPPWVYGAVVSLGMGTNKARASLVAAPPVAAGPPVPVQQATLIWTTEPLSTSAGHLIQQSPSAPNVTTLAADATGGSTTIRVINPTVLQPGLPLQFVKADGSGTGGGVPYATQQVNSDGTVKITPGLINAFTAGDFVYQVGVALITGQPVGVQYNSGPFGRTYDWSVSALVDNAGTLSATQAITAGKRVLVACYSVTFLTQVATAYVGTLTFADGSGTFWREGIAVQGIVGAIDRAALSGMELAGSGVGGTLTIALNNAQVASQFSRLSAGGYFV